MLSPKENFILQRDIYLSFIETIKRKANLYLKATQTTHHYDTDDYYIDDVTGDTIELHTEYSHCSGCGTDYSYFQVPISAIYGDYAEIEKLRQDKIEQERLQQIEAEKQKAIKEQKAKENKIKADYKKMKELEKQFSDPNFIELNKQFMCED